MNDVLYLLCDANNGDAPILRPSGIIIGALGVNPDRYLVEQERVFDAATIPIEQVTDPDYLAYVAIRAPVDVVPTWRLAPLGFRL